MTASLADCVVVSLAALVMGAAMSRCAPVCGQEGRHRDELPPVEAVGSRVVARHERVLTRDEVERRALAYSPAVAQALAEVEAAEGHWVQVGLPANPVVGYSGNQLGSGGRTEQHGVLISQEIPTGGKLRTSRAVAAAQIEHAEQRLAAEQIRVVTSARASFYELLAAQQRVELATKLADSSALTARVIEDLLEGREVGRSDLLQARIEADAARVVRERSHNQHRAASKQLAAMIGTEEDEVITVTGALAEDLPDIAWESALQRLLAESPELAMAAADLDRAEWELQRALAQVYPNLTVQGIVQQDNDIDGIDGAIQATVPLPVWNRNQGGIRQAEAQVTAAQHAISRVQQSLRQRLAAVYERYASARYSSETYRGSILDNARENYELSDELYRAGDVNYLTLLTAQRTHFEKNLAYLESLRDAWLALVEIEGFVLTGGAGGATDARPQPRY